jgi:hypothetical protein
MELDGYENYIIYKDGKVFNKKYNRLLRQRIDSTGYYKVTLSKNGISKNFRIHRLLAIHYLPNPNNYNVIDHIDRNPLNNELCNLRWTTRQKNMTNRKVNKTSQTQLKNIITTKKGYEVKIMRFGKSYRKNVKTLEDAIKIRDLTINFIVSD